MNKKIFCGLALLGTIAGVFVACGSGDVSKASVEDSTNIAIAETEYANKIDSALAACSADPSCNANAAASSASPVSSSSVVVEPGSSSSILVPSSSSKAVLSSSSVAINFSSSSKVVSSSSTLSSSSSGGTSDGSVNGTCAPVPATISKGESTVWTFAITSPAGVPGITAQAKASFDWTMTGSTEGTASGTGLKTTKGTYAASGSYGASLVVDGNNVKCSELQVNGAAISGCSCKAASSTVDVATGGAATWTVSGCTSLATITGYTWKDATGTSTTGTATLTTKNQTVTPVVSVANDDNTVQAVTCETVKATDSSAPDYVLDSTSSYSVPAGTYSMQYACKADQYYQTPVIAVAPSDGSSAAGTVNGTAFSLSAYGQSIVYNGTTTSGTMLSIVITSGTVTFKCQ
ncbi:MAG: hypothetical protein WCR04_04210 [Fibrobacteraceae bacterium]